MAHPIGVFYLLSLACLCECSKSTNLIYHHYEIITKFCVAIEKLLKNMDVTTSYTLGCSMFVLMLTSYAYIEGLGLMFHNITLQKRIVD